MVKGPRLVPLDGYPRYPQEQMCARARDFWRRWKI